MRNDDAIHFAPPTSVKVLEGGNATFRVIRLGRTSELISVNYTIVDDTAMAIDNDYDHRNRQIFFARGETQKYITISIPDDNRPEPDENFTVVLTSSTGDTSIYGNVVAVVTILANDDAHGIFHFDPRNDLNKTTKEGQDARFR